MSADSEKERNKGNVLKRISRIEGQLKGIKKMVEDERGCTDILTQMMAVSGAMKGTLSVMIRGNLCECMESMKENGKMDEGALEELVKTLSKVL